MAPGTAFRCSFHFAVQTSAWIQLALNLGLLGHTIITAIPPRFFINTGTYNYLKMLSFNFGVPHHELGAVIFLKLYISILGIAFFYVWVQGTNQRKVHYLQIWYVYAITICPITIALLVTADYVIPFSFALTTWLICFFGFYFTARRIMDIYDEFLYGTSEDTLQHETAKTPEVHLHLGTSVVSMNVNMTRPIQGSATTVKSVVK